MSKKKKRNIGQELIKGLKEILEFEKGNMKLKTTVVKVDDRTKKIVARATAMADKYSINELYAMLGKEVSKREKREAKTKRAKKNKKR